MKNAEVSPSLPVPLERLCDPAHWGYVSEQLEPIPFPLVSTDAHGFMTGMMTVATHYRYKYRLPLQAPLAALVSPSLYDTMSDYHGPLSRLDLTLSSFGVERPQVTIINPERFRYFDRDDGWSAKFTLPSPGVLVDFTEQDTA